MMINFSTLQPFVERGVEAKGAGWVGRVIGCCQGHMVLNDSCATIETCSKISPNTHSKTTIYGALLCSKTQSFFLFDGRLR